MTLEELNKVITINFLLLAIMLTVIGVVITVMLERIENKLNKKDKDE